MTTKKTTFFKILGVKINPLNYRSLSRRINYLTQTKKNNYICVAATHLIMECSNNKFLKNEINKSSINVTDGMPLVWISKIYGFKNVERIYGPDLMLKLLNYANKKKMKIALIGGVSNQTKIIANKIKKNYPNIKKIFGFDTPEKKISLSLNKKIISTINKYEVNLIFIGMGCPYQEKWMIDNSQKIKQGVTIGVGAAFDFYINKKKQAPIWMRKTGLEWLSRLFQEPKRLLYRYSILNIIFIFQISKQLIADFIYNPLVKIRK